MRITSGPRDVRAEELAARPSRVGTAADSVLQLQRAAGNRAVGQLVSRVAGTVPGTPRAALMQQLASSTARRTLRNWIPSTKMGRFDAEYLPSKGKLIITVRPHMTYVGPWTKAEKRDFETKFAKQTRKAWSGKHQFTCTRDGYQDLVVTPEVRCEFAPTLATAHFDLAIDHQKRGMTAMQRESYSNPAAISTGLFARQDAPVRPHDTPSSRCSLATHEVERIHMWLVASHAAQVTFRPDGDLSTDSRIALRAFMRAMERSELPSAAKVPIVAIGFDTAAERAGGGTRVAKRRLEKVKAELAPIAKRHPVKTRTIDQVIEHEEEMRDDALAGYEKLAAAGQENQAGTRGFYRRGGTYHTEAEAKITAFRAGKDTARVALKADEDWAKAYKDSDPYSILAHEFGHMLGNPDEYFGWGAEGLENKIAQLLASGNESDAREAIVLQAQRGVKNTDMDDAGRRDIQDRFTALVSSAGERIPTMTQKASTGLTTSIMNAGADVQRAHYVTLLEALGEITKPTLTMADWKIL